MGDAAARHADAISLLSAALDNIDHDLSTDALEALWKLSKTGRANVLMELIDRLGATWTVDDASVKALRQLRDDTEWVTSAISVLLDALQAGGYQTRRGAVKLLGMIGKAAADHPLVIPALNNVLQGNVHLEGSIAALFRGLRHTTLRYPDVVPTLTRAVQTDGDLEFHTLTSLVNATIARSWPVGVTDFFQAEEEAARDATTHRDNVVPKQIDMLRQEHGEFERAVIETLGKFGQVVNNHPGVILALIRILQYEERAANLVETCGRDEFGESTTLHRDLVAALINKLRHEHQPTKRAVIDALGRMGQAAATQYSVIMPAILDALQLEDEHLIDRVIGAFGMLRDTVAVHPDVYPAMIDALQKEYFFLRLEEVTSRPYLKVVDSVINAIKNRAEPVNLAAVEALQSIGGTATRDPYAIPILIKTLQDRIRLVNRIATAALTELGDVETYQAPFFTALVSRLWKNTYWFCRKTIEALGEFGGSAARDPIVIPALIEVLGRGNSIVQQETIKVLGGFGETAARHPAVIPALILGMHEGNCEVQKESVKAFRRFGETAARHTDVIPALINMIRSGKGNLIEQAVETLGAFGETAARHPDVLPIVCELIERNNIDHNSKSICRLCHALINLGECRLQVPKVLDCLHACLHDDDEDVTWNATQALGKAGVSAASRERVVSALLANVDESTSTLEREIPQVDLAWNVFRGNRRSGYLGMLYQPGHEERWLLNVANALDVLQRSGLRFFPLRMIGCDEAKINNEQLCQTPTYNVLHVADLAREG